MVHNKDDWPLELSIAPKSMADAEKLAVALAELVAEDPSLGVHTDAESGRTILKGMGELHLYAKIDVLQRTYDVEVERGRPQVAYRETITRPVGHSYTHKKQTGGSGEFAMVAFDVRPNPAEAGNTFESRLVGGDMPMAYIGGVAKGVGAALAAGPLGGFPVVDVAVALVDGRYHDVDSSALAFERAARAGLGEALKMAAPVIKEPIMKVAVVTPEDYLGSVMGDLSSRRGSIVGTDTRGNAQVIDALVPLANLFGYAHTLRALSRARATFTMRFDHYEVMPRGLGDGPPFRPAAIMRG